MEINVLVDEGLEGCPCASWLGNLAQQVLVAQGIDSNTELGLVVTDQKRMQKLNQSYLGRDEPTDVLAFSMLPTEQTPEADTPPFIAAPDGLWHLGEVIVSYTQAVIQAEEHQHSLEKEVAILITHGVLHLLGYKDGKPEPRRFMAAREAEVLYCLDVE